ncbi:MAG: sodium/proton-translocating pyrophosphatase, partial [Candidatus Saganbacteria bacterium]|nr:sodium/proton-translocating pyrophosphatase [Candidatus Saganbacteria bacterium]
MIFYPIYISMATGILGMFFVAYLAISVLKQDPGTKEMISISAAIHEGAMAFLKREYTAISIFIAAVFVVLTIGINIETAFAYLAGAICSLSAGYFGMRIATSANSRTAQAATKGLQKVLDVAFSGGAVMGMSVVSIGLFALSSVYLIFIKLGVDPIYATSLTAGFSMGASSVALFARVGGGIYTKAADVGADLVGKVEAGIPEDDPRNPAVIADLVGDNVGDVAGMGADLYESYVGAIVSGMVIAGATFLSFQDKLNGIMLSLLLASVGIIASIIGTSFVKTGRRFDPQRALRIGTWMSAALFALGSWALIFVWYKNIAVFYASLAGLIAGLVIGFIAEQYTSGKNVKLLAEASQTGAAT